MSTQSQKKVADKMSVAEKFRKMEEIAKQQDLPQPYWEPPGPAQASEPQLILMGETTPLQALEENYA